MPKFNVIIFCGPAEPNTKTRNYGAHRLATHMREHGYTCLIVDFCTILDWKTYQEILDLTMDENTYMVGISTTFLPRRIVPLDNMNPVYQEFDSFTGDIKTYTPAQAENTLLIDDLAHSRGASWLQYIKKINPKTKIVFGGTGVASYMDYKEVDNFMYGLSENMVIDYLNSVSGRGTKRIFNRVLDYDSKAQGTDWDFTTSATRYTDLDFITPNETLALEIGRGCRFSCSFCSFPLIGQRNINDYVKCEESLRTELMENYEKWGTTQYYVVDDTFNDSTEKLLRVKSVIDSLPFKFRFWCYLRADILAAHPEQIQILKDMGLEETFFGIETFHPLAGKSIGKGMKAEKIKAVLAKCKEIWKDEVFISAGFIVGLPYEGESSIAKTATYLQDPECPIHSAWLHQLSMFDSTADPRLKWLYKSEYDKHYEKHGYYFDPPKQLTDFVLWRKKEDGSGIYTYEQAKEIADHYNAIIPHKQVINFYLQSFDHPIISNRELTRKMPIEEYKELQGSLGDLTEIFYHTVKNKYLDPLLKKLKSD